MRKKTMILTRERTDEERIRRRLHGDRGAKFSGGKRPSVSLSDVTGCITTFVTKDLMLIEIWTDDNEEDSADKHDGGRERLHGEGEV